MAVAKHSNGRFLRKRFCPVNAVSSLRKTAAFSVLQNSVKGSGEIFLCVTLLVLFFLVRGDSPCFRCYQISYTVHLPGFVVIIIDVF